MTRKSVIGAALFVAVLVGAAPAFAAGSPHFIKSATSASLSGGGLVVNFKEAGLSAGSVSTITTTADATVTYECVNHGGKNPPAANKTTIQTSASTSGTFTVAKNGNLVGSQTTQVPSASSLGFSCPGGQTTTLVSVTYTNITITDSTSGASASLGSLSYTNPLAP